MRFIEEIVVEEFLPTIRSQLAGALRDRGLTQREVAAVLGISQSAVSKYAHGDVTVNERIASDERVVGVVEELADGLADGSIEPIQALVELEVLIRTLEEGGDLLAQFHAEAEPALAEHGGRFRVHDADSPLLSRERVRASVRRGLQMLEATSGFADLIPAVGSNLVACTPDAASIDDVVGVPGRIVDVKGRATVPADPEFGVSEHVATVLLAARRAGADAAAACNIRYDPTLVAELATDRTAAEFDESGDVAASVEAAVEAAPAATVLYQTGGEGIEPLIYVLDDDAEAVATTIRELVRTLR